MIVFVDEVAFLTAYQPDRKLRDRALAAIATLTTQGRAVGYCVVGALQDPRKDVLTIRNLFPDRIAMRLDEPEQVDMVLGDGARDRGALADQISTDPATRRRHRLRPARSRPRPGTRPRRLGSDDDIDAMCAQYAPLARPRSLAGSRRHERASRPGGPTTRARSAAPACTSPTTWPGPGQPGLPPVRLVRHLADHPRRPPGDPRLPRRAPGHAAGPRPPSVT